MFYIIGLLIHHFRLAMWKQLHVKGILCSSWPWFFLFCFILFWAFLKTCDFRLNAVPCLMLVWSWSVSPQWIFCCHKINFCFLFLLVWRGWLIVMVGILCSILCFKRFIGWKVSRKACRCECQQWFWFCQGW